MRRVPFRLLACLALSLMLHAIIMIFDLVRLEKSISPANSGSNIRLEANLHPAVMVPLDAHENGVRPRPILEYKDRLLATPERNQDLVTKLGISRVGIEAYFPPRLLTRRPYPLDSIDPSPTHLKFDGLVGSARIVLLISMEGKVDRAIVIDSSLPEIVVDSAIKAFKAARFSPGYLNERAVRSQFLVELGPPVPAASSGEPESAKQIRERQLKSRQDE